MDPEIIILSKEKNKYYMISLIFMWNLKKWYKWTNLQNKQNLRHRKQTYHYQRGRVWVKVAQSCPTPCNPMDDTVHRILPGQNTGVGSLSLLKGNFPTQGSNPGHPHCRQILYQLSHKRSPRTWEWVAYPFSRGSSQPRNWNRGLQHCRQILYQLSYQGSPSMNHMHSLVMLLCSLF